MKGFCQFTASFEMPCPLCATKVPAGQFHQCEVSDENLKPHKYRRACGCPACMETFQRRLKARNEKGRI